MPRVAGCRRAVAVAVAVVLATAVLTSGCAGLRFRNDHRLHFDAPGSLAKVTLPVTLRWTMRDPGAELRSYAVFIDRSPVKPGQSLRAVFSDERGCRTDPACPSPDQLASRGVYVTASTQLDIAHVPILPAGTGRKIHTVTVVLLDAQGQRLGESAWSRDLEIPDSLVAS